MRIGQKVVCISVAMHGGAPNPIASYPSVGSVYTIRGMFPYKDRTCLLFEELDNSHITWAGGNECGFCSTRFRPVAERKTDISIFTEMLTPSPRRVKKLVAITTSQRAEK